MPIALVVMVVLGIATANFAGENVSLTRHIESQQVEITKNKGSIDTLTDSKTKLETELSNERTKSAELQKENTDLKVELQAKIERESRREANAYAWGNCTWYVKEKVPYIGGTWGNAKSWLASSKSYGFDTGSTPKQGAVGVSLEGYYGHVVYVESINKDGSVMISEMNNADLGGFNIVNTRTVSSQSFIYIYT